MPHLRRTLLRLLKAPQQKVYPRTMLSMVSLSVLLQNADLPRYQ